MRVLVVGLCLLLGSAGWAQLEADEFWEPPDEDVLTPAEELQYQQQMADWARYWQERTEALPEGPLKWLLVDSAGSSSSLNELDEIPLPFVASGDVAVVAAGWLLHCPDEGESTQDCRLLLDSWQRLQPQGGYARLAELALLVQDDAENEVLEQAFMQVFAASDWSRPWSPVLVEMAEFLLARQQSEPPRPRPRSEWRCGTAEMVPLMVLSAEHELWLHSQLCGSDIELEPAMAMRCRELAAVAWRSSAEIYVLEQVAELFGEDRHRDWIDRAEDYLESLMDDDVLTSQFIRTVGLHGSAVVAEQAIGPRPPLRLH